MGDAALPDAVAAARLFAEIGDEMHRGRALWSVACAHDILGQTAKSERAADQALTLARRTGDRWGEASAFNSRWRQNVDLAKRLRGLHQALAGYLASGHVSGQAAIYNNLALAYRALGLYRRSSRMALRSMEIRRRLHDYSNVVNAATILGGNEYLTGNVATARKHLAEIESTGSLPGAKGDGTWALGMDWFCGMIANLERDGVAAVPFLESALRRVRPMPETSFQILVLTDLCIAHLLAGEPDAALEASRRAVELYGARERRRWALASPRTRLVVAPSRARSEGRCTASRKSAGRLRAAAGRHQCAGRRRLRRSCLNRSTATVPSSGHDRMRARAVLRQASNGTSPERRIARAVRAPRRYGDALNSCTASQRCTSFWSMRSPAIRRRARAAGAGRQKRTGRRHLARSQRRRRRSAAPGRLATGRGSPRAR
jgi:tetratricopeptide (TPR) repeat protein